MSVTFFLSMLSVRSSENIFQFDLWSLRKCDIIIYSIFVHWGPFWPILLRSLIFGFEGLTTHNLLLIFSHLKWLCASYIASMLIFEFNLILIFSLQNLGLALCWVYIFLTDYLCTFYCGFIRWVANHYRWIVWKLACYERCYPAKTVGKFLTISNVLEELKYRYLNYLKSYFH